MIVIPAIFFKAETVLKWGVKRTTVYDESDNQYKYIIYLDSGLMVIPMKLTELKFYCPYLLCINLFQCFVCLLEKYYVYKQKFFC